MFPEDLIQRAGKCLVSPVYSLLLTRFPLASGSSTLNPWSTAVLDKASSLVQEYSSLETVSGEALRRIAADLRGEIARHAHHVEYLTSFICSLHARLESVEAQLATTLTVSASEANSAAPLLAGSALFAEAEFPPLSSATPNASSSSEGASSAAAANDGA